MKKRVLILFVGFLSLFLVSCNKESFTVAFNSNGGNEIAAMEVNEGQSLTEVIPLKEGYDFIGWYLDSQLTQAFDASSPLVDEMTLYAKWALQNYEINFYDGEDLLSTISISYGQTFLDAFNKQDDVSDKEVLAAYDDADMTSIVSVNDLIISDQDIYLSVIKDNSLVLNYYYSQTLEFSDINGIFALSTNGMLLRIYAQEFNYEDEEEQMVYLCLNARLNLFGDEVVTEIIHTTYNQVVFKTSGNRILIFGDNQNGTLGIGSGDIVIEGETVELSRIIDLDEGEEISSVVGSYYNMIASTTRGRVFFWGTIVHHDGTKEEYFTPIDVSDYFDFQDDDVFTEDLWFQQKLFYYDSMIGSFHSTKGVYVIGSLLEDIEDAFSDLPMFVNMADIFQLDDPYIYCLFVDNELMYVTDQGVIYGIYNDINESVLDLNEDETVVFMSLFNELYFTSEGRILRYDYKEITLDVTDEFLEAGETWTNIYKLYTQDVEESGILLQTSHNRILYLNNGFGIDVSEVMAYYGLTMDDIKTTQTQSLFLKDGIFYQLTFEGFKEKKLNALVAEQHIYEQPMEIEVEAIESSDFMFDRWADMYSDARVEDIVSATGVYDVIPIFKTKEYVRIMLNVEDAIYNEMKIVGTKLDEDDLKNIIPYGYEFVLLSGEGSIIEYGDRFTSDMEGRVYIVNLNHLDGYSATLNFIYPEESRMEIVESFVVEGDALSDVPSLFSSYEYNKTTYIEGFYIDEEMTQSYDVDDVLASDMTIYIKILPRA